MQNGGQSIQARGNSQATNSTGACDGTTLVEAPTRPNLACRISVLTRVCRPSAQLVPHEFAADSKSADVDTVKTAQTPIFRLVSIATWSMAGCDKSWREEKSAADENLHVYLNDHLAGSVAAIELLDALIAHHSEAGRRFAPANGAQTLSQLARIFCSLMFERHTLANLSSAKDSYAGGGPRNGSIRSNRGSVTARLVRALSKIASMMRWSCNPSSPGVYGFRLFKTQSAI